MRNKAGAVPWMVQVVVGNGREIARYFEEGCLPMKSSRLRGTLARELVSQNESKDGMRKVLHWQNCAWKLHWHTKNLTGYISLGVSWEDFQFLCLTFVFFCTHRCLERSKQSSLCALLTLRIGPRFIDS